MLRQTGQRILGLWTLGLALILVASCGDARDAGSSSDEARQGGGGNTNIGFGGAQDFAYFRGLLDAGIVPRSADLDPSGFIAEHHSTLPEPDCGQQVCVQGMLGVMGNLINGANCTLMQIGLNSSIAVEDMEVPDLALTVVVDVSGSMESAGKIGFVRQGLQTLVNQMGDNDRIALVSYSGEAEVLLESGELGGRRNELMAAIAGLAAGGATNIYDGLEVGFQEAIRTFDGDYQNRVVFLSDGAPTAGIIDNDEIVSMAATYNSEGVGLTSIGLGTSFNYELMSNLALQGDGNFYFVESADSIDEVFQEELAYFSVPIALDVVIELEVGPHYRFGRAVGSPFWEDTDRGGRLEVPSVFVAHRTSDTDTGDFDGRRGGGSALLVEIMPEGTGEELSSAEVASVTLSYRDPRTGELIDQQARSVFPHSPDHTPQSGHFDSEAVTKSFVVLNILTGLEMATDWFHEGQGADAIDVLLRLIAAAEDYNDGIADGEGDLDIARDIEVMGDLVQVLEDNGALEPEVEFPEDPWPAD